MNILRSIRHKEKGAIGIVLVAVLSMLVVTTTTVSIIVVQNLGDDKAEPLVPDWWNGPDPAPLGDAGTGWLELTDERTKYSSTRAEYVDWIPTNERTLETSLIPVHYKDNQSNSQEQWKVINTTIIESDRPNWDWEVTKGNWQLLIASNTTVAIGKEGQWVGFRFDGAAYLDIASKDYEVLFTRDESAVPDVSNNSIRWENIVPGVNLEYMYTSSTFKENIEITQAARNWLEANPPSNFGLSNQDSYLGGWITCDWRNAYSAQTENGTPINWDVANEFEGTRIDFKHPVLEHIVMALPLGYARHTDNWETEPIPVRSRFMKIGANHRVIFGSKVTSLNQMSEGTIIIDPSLEETVGASLDDAMKRYHTSWYSNSYGYDLSGTASTSARQYCTGMRFQTVALDSVDTVNDARLNLTAAFSRSGDNCNTNLGGEDIDDATAFSTEANWDTRFPSTLTTANVSWDDIGAWNDGTVYSSPDIDTVVQEIIDRAGWNTGQDMVIFWHDYYDRSDDVGLRMGSGYDVGGGSEAPVLYISYTDGCTVSITNSPSTYGYGTVESSSSYATGLTYFTLTNTGGCSIDVTINGTDMTGGTTWTLSDTATAGSNIIGVKAGLEGGSYNIIVKKNTPFNDLKTGLAASGTQKWGMTLWTPTNSPTDGNLRTGYITLTGTEA